MSSQLTVPSLPRSQMFTGNIMIREWQDFFRDLFTRVGSFEELTNTELAEILNFDGLIANRILSTDSEKGFESVADLTDWIIETIGDIDVKDNGDGTVTVSISDFFLFASVLGTSNQILITNNGDGNITLSTPQDIDTAADVNFNTLTAVDKVVSYKRDVIRYSRRF